LTVLVISVIGAGPAFAEDMACDQTTIKSLADCVQMAADMGHITNPLLVNSLLAKTTAAQTALDRDQSATAIYILQAFIRQVSGVAGRQIDAEHAQHMIMHAQNIIASLQTSGA
jgi:hypothetical protein